MESKAVFFCSKNSFACILAQAREVKALKAGETGPLHLDVPGS